MSKKNKPNTNGYVYSTDPDFSFEEENQDIITPAPSLQPLKISLDTRHRAGKSVTLITGFEGSHSDLEALGKKLRTLCGTGGSAKDGEVIIQGDQRERALQWLLKNGYKKSRKV